MLPDTLAVFLPLLARVVLASVFGLSGMAKLAGRRAAGQSLTEFGVPQRIAELSASFLAAAEVLCAVALLPTATAWLGATGVALLLTLFIGVLVATLARGRRPACHCFGQLRSEPIGASTVVRNIALLAAAVFVLWDVAPRTNDSAHIAASWPIAMHAVATASPVSLAAIVSVVALAIVGMVLLSVLRQYGRVLIRVERIESQLGIEQSPVPAGLQVGTTAPAFDLASLDGGRVSLAALQSRANSLLLVFIEPGCGPCSDLLPDLARAQQRFADTGGPGHAAPALVAIVSRGSAQENRAKTSDLGILNLLLQRNREVASAYGVLGTPSAVRLTNGVIASPLASGTDAVRDLLAAALDPAEVLKIGPGDDLPSFTLKDLEGRPTELRGLASNRTLFLFWSPTCGYCQDMLADLKVWEHRADSSDTNLVVISQGSIALNRQYALRSRVVLDDNFTVGRALGATGTPSAVLIENGRVASDVRAGAQAVFALAAPKRTFAGQASA